jgi:hypothetical protein
MSDRDQLAVRVAELRRHFEEHFQAHEFGRGFTPDELKLRQQIIDLSVIDSCERAGRAPRKRADEARARVLDGISLSECPLELDETPVSIRERERAIVGRARFRAAVERVIRSAPRRALPSSVQRPREHAPRSRRTRTGPRASRDGPDEPEPPLRRPTELTPLQQAQLLSAAAYEVARVAGERVFETFLDIEAIRLARETARRWETAA